MVGGLLHFRLLFTIWLFSIVGVEGPLNFTVTFPNNQLIKRSRCHERVEPAPSENRYRKSRLVLFYWAFRGGILIDFHGNLHYESISNMNEYVNGQLTTLSLI